MTIRPHETGGCWQCGVNTPVVYLEPRSGTNWIPTVKGLRAEHWSRPYALCLPCLGLWFPGWGADHVEDWLEGQKHRAEMWERDKQVRLEADDRDLAAWLAGVVSATSHKRREAPNA